MNEKGLEGGGHKCNMKKHRAYFCNKHSSTRKKKSFSARGGASSTDGYPTCSPFRRNKHSIRRCREKVVVVVVVVQQQQLRKISISISIVMVASDLSNPVPSTPKLRVLCFHGFRTSADIFKKQISRWDSSILDLLDLVSSLYIHPFWIMAISDFDE